MYIWSPYMYYVTYGPHILHGIGILWSPDLMWNRYCMVLPCVKCIHVLYDSYGPPYIIWYRYLMVPHMYVWSPHMYCMTLMVPIPYME